MLTAGPNKTSVFVADDDGDVVGFAAGNMLQEPRHELDAELSAVYVRRDLQRAGIGGGSWRPSRARNGRTAQPGSSSG